MSPKKSIRKRTQTLYPAVAAPEIPEQNLFTSYRWGWYFFSMMIPFAGIFIALLLFDEETREVRRVGRTCLLIGFLIWVVFPVVVLLGILLVGALTAFSFVSDMMPTD